MQRIPTLLYGPLLGLNEGKAEAAEVNLLFPPPAAVKRKEL